MTDIIKNSNEAKDSSQIAPLRLSPEKFAELRKKGKIDLRRKSVEPPYTIKIDGIGALPRKVQARQEPSSHHSISRHSWL